MGPTIVETMLSRYSYADRIGAENALKQVAQNIVLCGLSRTDFFNHAAFYGGTALRIFYGLDRFSEDMDFSLIESEEEFSLETYLPVVSEELKNCGLEFSYAIKEKTKKTAIQSAFLKASTKEALLRIQVTDEIVKKIARSDLVKIKVGIDTNPPPYARNEEKISFLPYPHQVKLYDKSSLFAGKLHAILCRNWKHRVKGRDLYDFLFYVSRQTPINMRHLEARLTQSKTMSDDETLTLESLQVRLCEKFAEIDFNDAKLDVLPFLEEKRKRDLDFWSEIIFCEAAKSLVVSSKENQKA